MPHRPQYLLILLLPGCSGQLQRTFIFILKSSKQLSFLWPNQMPLKLQQDNMSSEPEVTDNKASSHHEEKDPLESNQFHLLC